MAHNVYEQRLAETNEAIRVLEREMRNEAAGDFPCNDTLAGMTRRWAKLQQRRDQDQEMVDRNNEITKEKAGLF